MIEQINNLAEVWWTWMSEMFWQVGLLIILIATIDRLIRRWAWPQLRYALWSLILLKLVLSPALSLPSAVTPRLRPVVTQLLESATKQRLDVTGQPKAIRSADYEFSRAAMQPYPVFAKPGFDTISYKQPYDTMFDTGAPVVRQHDTLILTPPGPRLGWRVYVMAVWLLGVVTLSTWLALKLRRLGKQHLNQSRQPALPESFYNQMDRCAQQLKLRRKPRVVATARIQSPAVFGLFRPVLLMPAGYIRRLSRKDVEHMLLHELAHIKRGDLPAHSFCMLLLMFYWYNPLLWLVHRQLRHIRELCCDATVATLLRDKTAEYRQTLLDAARQFLVMPVEPALGLVGLFEDPNRFITRINWLKKPIWRYRTMKNIAVITITLILLACVLPMAQGQNPQTENPGVSPEPAVEISTQNKETTEEQQTLKRLEKQLQQLEIENQKLKKELQALAQDREKAVQAKGPVKVTKQEAADAKDKAVKPRIKASKDASKAEAEALKAAAHAKQWEHWANSDEFKQWQKDMEVWAKEQAKIHENAQKPNGDAFSSATHPMPAMPPMPVMPHPEAGQKHLDMNAHADAHVDVDAHVAVVPEVTVTIPPMSTGVAVPVLPDGQESVDGISIKSGKTKDGKFAATKLMQLDLKVEPGKPFIVRNSVGNITLRPSKDGTCEAKAVIRAEADTAAEAQKKVQEISMNVESSKEKFYLKPVKPDDNQWSELNVDLIITIPSDVQPDIKTDMGSIELLNLERQIKAVTDMGSIKAVNTTGNLELTTRMGSIDFAAPKDLSARLLADTKMGSIKSELPLDIDQSDMFKKKAEGTIGTGQANIRLHTDMGSVRLRWQSASEPKAASDKF